MVASSTLLTPTQRYAAGALLALALRQSQIHQSHLVGPFEAAASTATAEEPDCCSSISSEIDGGDALLWTHESFGLLRPVFTFLEIDQKAWPGLEGTARLSSAKHHIGAFLKIIYEDDSEITQERSEEALALANAVDAMAMSLYGDKEQQQHVKHKCLGKSSADSSLYKNTEESAINQLMCSEQNSKEVLLKRNRTVDHHDSSSNEEHEVLECASPVNYHKNVVVLFELLSACLSDAPYHDSKQNCQQRKGYDARHRVALRLLATWLDVKWIKVEALEIIVACSAMAAAQEEEEHAAEDEAEKSAWSQWKRGGIIGAAALTGGTVLAITGGLAAPAIAAGFSGLAPTLGTLVPAIGASGFATAASAAGSVAGSAAIAASFGAAGAGLTGSKMARRLGNVEEFEFRPIGEHPDQGRLAVGIFVSGFVFEEDDFVKPWLGVGDNLESYAILWESKNLIAVSTAIQDWLTSKLTSELIKQGAMMTVLSSLVTALAWPATLLEVADFIDNKWSIAVDRCDKAGELLAEVLLKGLQGNRPVTLIGFSLGARVIFKCLQELAESGNNEGIIERIVLLGAPIPLEGESWQRARKMVAGRFINVFSANDWILGVTFRASLLSQGLAGIQPVDIQGIENVDVTDLVDGHSSYLLGLQQILEQLELDSYYPVLLSATPPASRGG